MRYNLYQQQQQLQLEQAAQQVHAVPMTVVPLQLAEMSSANAHSSLSRAWSAFGSRGSLAAAGSVSGADIEAAGLTPLATAFHGARVVCMDVCQQVPLIVTAAQDRELR